MKWKGNCIKIEITLTIKLHWNCNFICNKISLNKLQNAKFKSTENLMALKMQWHLKFNGIENIISLKCNCNDTSMKSFKILQIWFHCKMKCTERLKIKSSKCTRTMHFNKNLNYTTMQIFLKNYLNY